MTSHIVQFRCESLAIVEKVPTKGLPEVLNRKVIPLGGLQAGYNWRGLFVRAESIHQNVSWSGYPIGGITVQMLLLAPVEDICKAQASQA